MAHDRTFDIAFVGLKPGVHEYAYEIGDKFFAEYGQQDFKNCTSEVKLQLDKKQGFMILRFEIGGKVDVTCDRCGNTLPMQLWDDFTMIVKMVDNPDEMNEQEEDPDVFYISRSESHLHVANWIFEFINLSLPMQRMCSEEEMGGPYCNKEVLAMLEKMEEEKKPIQHPVWKDLEKFKNLDN
jgi:uncharacterized metal-binding protein YceD (DUF177 family)